MNNTPNNVGIRSTNKFAGTTLSNCDDLSNAVALISDPEGTSYKCMAVPKLDAWYNENRAHIKEITTVDEKEKYAEDIKQQKLSEMIAVSKQEDLNRDEQRKMLLEISKQYAFIEGEISREITENKSKAESKSRRRLQKNKSALAKKRMKESLVIPMIEAIFALNDEKKRMTVKQRRLIADCELLRSEIALLKNSAHDNEKRANVTAAEGHEFSRTNGSCSDTHIIQEPEIENVTKKSSVTQDSNMDIAAQRLHLTSQFTYTHSALISPPPSPPPPPVHHPTCEQLHVNVTTSVHERHRTALSCMLRRMLQLRQCKEAWNSLFDIDPVDSVRKLRCAEAHHMSGKYSTTASTDQLCTMENYQLRSFGNLSAMNILSSAKLDTNWYFAPYRSYNNIAVGTVIWETETDDEDLYFKQPVRRSGYAHDNSCGDFIALYIDEESNFVEVYYEMLKSTTERDRAVIRFDYDLFMNATNTVNADTAVSGLLRAVSFSDLVQEYRHCRFCRATPGICVCKLQFFPPTDPFDYGRNVKNMLNMVGEYVGTSYRYLREKQFLGEFFVTCSVEGGIGSVDRARRLFENGMRQCLLYVPTTIPNSPSILPLIHDPISPDALRLPHTVFPSNEDSIFGGAAAADSKKANSAIPDSSAIDSLLGLVPTVPIITTGTGFGDNMDVPQPQQLHPLSQPLAQLSQPLLASSTVSLHGPIGQRQLHHHQVAATSPPGYFDNLSALENSQHGVPAS